jgi:hypothetical protein
MVHVIVPVIVSQILSTEKDSNLQALRLLDPEGGAHARPCMPHRRHHCSGMHKLQVKHTVSLNVSVTPCVLALGATLRVTVGEEHRARAVKLLKMEFDLTDSPGWIVLSRDWGWIDFR